MELTKLIQEKINEWFISNDFTNFINWLKNDNTKPLLEYFYQYSKSIINNIDFINETIKYIKENLEISDYKIQSINWDGQLKRFIHNNKELIYDKFKEFSINRKFSDYYQSYDHTEFDNFIEQEFIKFYKKEVPNMTVKNKDLFLSGHTLQLDEQCYELIKDKYNQYNKWDIIYVIRELISGYIKRYKKEIEKIQSKATKKLNKFCKDLIKAIKKDLNTFVLKVQFDKKNNGSYDFSWEDTNFNGNSRNDAIDIIKYICNHKSLMQQLVPNINIKQLENECNIKINEYFLDYYYNNYDESLQQVARKYILELQKEVVNKRAQKLDEKNDDDKIGKLSTFKLNYDITNDYERSCPALICMNDKHSFILIGNFGEAHTTLKNRFDNRIYKLQNRKMCYAYVLGRILFTTESIIKACNVTKEDITQAMKKDGRFSKLYLIPQFKRKKVIRLAKKIFF